MVQFHGFKNGRYQIFETEHGVKLDFHGADADKFEQVNPPGRPCRVVGFSLTLKDLETFFPGFTKGLPETREPKERLDVDDDSGADAALRDAMDAAIDANPVTDPIDVLIDILADHITVDDTYQCLVGCIIRDLAAHAPEVEEPAEVAATDGQWVN